jgi:hypothetical protein
LRLRKDRQPKIILGNTANRATIRGSQSDRGTVKYARMMNLLSSGGKGDRASRLGMAFDLPREQVSQGHLLFMTEISQLLFSLPVMFA